MAEKVRKVKGPDGSIIEVSVPDNATNYQIQLAAKKQWDQTKKASAPSVNLTSQDTTAPVVKPSLNLTAQDTTAPSVPTSPTGTATGIQAGNDGFISKAKNVVRDVGQSVFPASTNPFIESVLSLIPETSEEAKPLVRNIISGAAGTFAGVAVGPETYPVVSGLAASATMAFMDQALRHATKDDTGSNLFPDSPVAAGLEQTLLNEIGGRVASGVVKGAKELRFPGSVSKTVHGVTDELLNLKPTYAQFDKAISGSDLLEDVASRGAKVRGIEESTTLAKKRVDEFVQKITGRSTPVKNAAGKSTGQRVAPSSEALAEMQKAELTNSFNASKAASNAEATNFLRIAELNDMSIPQPPIVKNTGIFNANGQPIITSIPQPPKIVKGATFGHNVLSAVAETAKKMVDSGIRPDPENKLWNVLEDISHKFGTELEHLTPNSPNQHIPISAADAWAMKQQINDLAEWDPIKGISKQDTQFKYLSKAINKDIDQSIPLWQNQPLTAAKSWGRAKAIVEQRNKVFTPLGETGKGSKTLLSTVNSPDPDVYAIMDDQKKLQRYLVTGDLKINGRQIYSSNAKRDMQGQGIQRIWNDNWTPTNPMNTEIGKFNGDKAATDWIRFRDSKAGKLLYNGQTAKNFDEVFDAIRKVTADPNAGSNWVHYRFATNTMGLASTLLAGHFGDMGTISRLGITGGYISLGGLAKVMTNKRAAPVMLAMLHGKPLGMSFQAASRIIMQSLSGSGLTLIGNDGNEVAGVVGTDGNVRPTQR